MPKVGARAILLAVALPLAGFAAEGDWGYAHNMYILKSLNEKWSLLHRSQFALRDDMSDFFFGFADIGVGYKFHPDWRMDGVYRRAWLQPGEKWLIEDRPLVNLTWFGKINDARLSNRSRVEFREYRWDKKDDIRYRNETRLDLPWEVLPLGIKPYFEEEFFWGKESRKVEMNWLTGGLYCKPSHSTKLKLGYRWIAIRDGSGRENRNQLVTGLNLFFNPSDGNRESDQTTSPEPVAKPLSLHANQTSAMGVPLLDSWKRNHRHEPSRPEAPWTA